MPRPAWATFVWASRIMRSTMKLFFGRITGCLKPSENSSDLLSLPPTRMSPFRSRKGSRRYHVLDFLISDFIAFANWRSLSQSTRRTFCRASISLGNAPLCTNFRMVFSALILLLLGACVSRLLYASLCQLHPWEAVPSHRS